MDADTKPRNILREMIDTLLDEWSDGEPGLHMTSIVWGDNADVNGCIHIVPLGEAQEAFETLLPPVALQTWTETVARQYDTGEEGCLVEVPGLFHYDHRGCRAYFAGKQWGPTVAGITRIQTEQQEMREDAENEGEGDG